MASRPGQLLVDHLTNTAALCAGIRDKKVVFAAPDEMELLGDTAWLIGFAHDLGKATSFFQEYLQEENEKKRRRLKNKPETHHGLLSALFAYRIVVDFVVRRNLSEHRLFRYLPILSFLIVKKHHGNPKNLKDEILSVKGQLPVIKKQLASIEPGEFEWILQKCPYGGFDLAAFINGVEDLINRTIWKEEKISWRRYCKTGSLDLYFLFQFLFSALLAADKSDAIGVGVTAARPELANDLVDRYKAVAFKGHNSRNQINPIRDEIYTAVVSSIDTLPLERRIFSINVPTGTGKTLTGLSFALKLRERIFHREGYLPRIVYSLPFLSIIEQNFNEFEKVFQVVTRQRPGSEVLLKHHHLAEITYQFTDAEELPSEESQFLIEGWESEIVVTTFMQLFHTLISNKNRMLRKFNALVNAIVILDEIQTMPYKYWYLIRKLFLRFAEVFNTRFIMMTATQPLIFKKDECMELIPPELKNHYIKQLDRITFINKSHDTLTLKEFTEVLHTDISRYPNDDFLIVLNTINSSITVYNDLKEFMKEQGIADVDIYYLSTNIIPKHRLQRINAIKESDNRKVIVSTQLVEAGVDIDIDRVYRDFAPLDSLNQVAGRCNRNFSKGKKGVMTVFSLKDGQEYYRYIYGRGDLSISKTRDVLEGKKELTEGQFLDLGDDYFKRLRNAAADDQAEYLLDQLGKLNLETVCEDKGGKFTLIEAEYPTRDLFIEIDEEAAEIWERYTIACRIKDPFARKTQISRLKKDFYNYVISVPVKKLPGGTAGESAVLYINKDMLQTTYREDTGFIRTDLVQYVF